MVVFLILIHILLDVSMTKMLFRILYFLLRRSSNHIYAHGKRRLFQAMEILTGNIKLFNIKHLMDSLIERSQIKYTLFEI